MIFEEGKNEAKFEKNQQIEAEWVDGCYFWEGLAECAGRAEALELGKFCSLILSRCAPQRGRRI